MITSVTTLEPVPRPSAVEAVIDQMQRQLTAGNWSVGDRIPGEYDLAARLAVSRPAVREAIRALSHIGVLEVRRGDGTYVRSAVDPRPLLRRVEHATLRDVFELQQAYDVQAARLAAWRRTEEDLVRLHALLKDRDTAAGAEEFGAADALFHLGVAEASHNALLAEAFRYFQSRLRESFSAVRLDRELPDAGPEAHRAVVDAIAARDADAAGRAAESVIVPILNALEALL
jgi:DNA-binding FadR family transcriptional regulator